MTVRLSQALRDWAPREGSRIGPIPERIAFTAVMIAAAVLLFAALVLLR